MLVGCLAVLLPAGAWSAATLDAEPATVRRDGTAGATGFGEVTPLHEPAVTTLPVPTTSAPAPSTTLPSATVTTKAPAPTTTTAPVTSSTTTTTLNRVTPGNLAPAATWKAEVPGLSVSLRMDPETPVAGQAVRFHLEFTGVDRCCHVFVHFGDEDRWILHNQLVCTYEDELVPGRQTVELTHTYEKPGAYLAEVRIHDGSMCEPFPATGPPFRHIELPACLAVGPGNAGATGCRPAPAPSASGFGPVVGR
ncbi:MAG TPA: hypothetical protein VJ653_04845 [Acidimicrobiales bacterium]|nr:hypothetical protein [Acidimicrobiales bacterium]